MLRDQEFNFNAKEVELSPPKSPLRPFRARSKPLPSADHQPIVPPLPHETAQWLMDLMGRGHAPEAFQSLVVAAAAESKEPDSSPIVLPFSLIDIMNRSIDHACCLINQTDSVRIAMMPLVRLEEVTESNTSRLWIRFLDAPVPPSSCIGSVSHSALVAHNMRLQDPQSPQECLVSFDGVVLGLSTVWRRVYRRTLVCSSCESDFQLLEGQSRPYDSSCCRSPCITEDLSKRILVPCQDLLIGNLSSAQCHLPRSSIRAESILVSLVDDLVVPSSKKPRRALEVGDCISILGFARASVHPLGNQGWGQGKQVQATTHVTAMSITLSCPHLSTAWVDAHNPSNLSNPPGSITRGVEGGEGDMVRGREEEEAVNLNIILSAFSGSLVGCDSVEIPYQVSLALLLSATNAAAATALASKPPAIDLCAPSSKGKKTTQADKDGVTRPIHVLILGDADCPMLLDRVLRPAALALSPHMTHLSGPHSDHPFVPHATPYQPLPSPQPPPSLVDGSDGYRGSNNGGRLLTDEVGRGALMIRSSLLTATNRGLFIADGRSLGSTPKQKLDILECMMRGSFDISASESIGGGPWAAKGAGGGSSSFKVPMTSTLWATSSSSQVTNKGGSRLGGAEPDGFDLIVKWESSGDAFVTLGLLDLREEGGENMDQAQGGENMGQAQLDDGSNRAVTYLRRRLASVAKSASAVDKESVDKESELDDIDGSSKGGEGGRLRFTSESLAILQRFVMSVRQSFDPGRGGGGGGGSRSSAIASLVQLLVSLATASARIMLRSSVEPFPDCTMAIFLCHVTLKHRLETSGYHNTCLPDSLDVSTDHDGGGGGDAMIIDGGMNRLDLGSWLLGLHDHLELTLREVAAPTGSLVDGFDWPSEI